MKSKPDLTVEGYFEGFPGFRELFKDHGKVALPAL